MTSAAEQPHLNPVSPQNLLDPIPLYRNLRNEEPVHWSSTAHGWFVTRYRDVMNCFRDPRLSANRARFTEAQLQGLDPIVVRDFIAMAQKQIVWMDGVEHIRARRQVLAAFTPQMVESWHPMICRVMDDLVKRVKPQGRMDLVKEISYQLPALVIAEIFGIPVEERTRFQDWAEPLAQFTALAPGDDIPKVARNANRAMVELRDFLAALVEKRRQELDGAEKHGQKHGEDVLSRMLLVQQQEESHRLSTEELVLNALLLLSAGHLTTTDQVSNGVHALLSHPEQLQKLQEEPRLLRSAVEEMLRFSPAVPYIHRVAVETFQLHGQTIRKGDVVFLAMAAANRDPEAFSDPDRFDITRGNQSKHLSFASGQHHCMGSGLARRELEIAVETLMRELPNLRLDEEQSPQIKCHNLIFRGFKQLPLRW